jgi:hypothetical protein
MKRRIETRVVGVCLGSFLGHRSLLA